MFDYHSARETMLDSQIRTNDVTDRNVQAAFGAVPREKFVPEHKMALAYGDTNVDLGGDRWLVRPRDFSKMIAAADIQKSDVVLDIACGSGYSVAIMAHLAETVVGLEEDQDMIDLASARLEACDISNVAIVKGSLKAGASEHGPFDVIFVGSAISEVPSNWFSQLANGGRLICARQEGPLCRVVVFVKSGDSIAERIVFDANLPLLKGFEAEPEFVL